jgi:hypothetical protein
VATCRGPHGLDSIIVGYYGGKDLFYVARVRNGFVPATRRMVYEKLKPVVIDKCLVCESTGDRTRPMG